MNVQVGKLERIIQYVEEKDADAEPSFVAALRARAEFLRNRLAAYEAALEQLN